MNLVEVSTWIQDGYKIAYANRASLPKEESRIYPIQSYVLGYVMRQSGGHINPAVIEDLISMETSVPDENGCTQC